MAIFGLFKSKKEREAEALIERLNDRLYPLGEEDIRYDCQRIGALVHGKLAGDALRQFVTGCKAVVAISKRDDDDMVSSVIMRCKGAISAAEARDVYVYLAGEALYRSLVFGQIKSNGYAVTAQHWAEIDAISRVWQQGTTSDTVPGGHGEFGFAPTNPIPTVCIQGSETYLSKLRYGGRGVASTRLGSTGSSVTAGKIDIYHLSIDDRELGALHICPYHRKNSKLAPRGFSLA